MKLLTKALERVLRNNAQSKNKTRNKPVLKVFNPCGAATWLFSELADDGDTLFGLCDLGMGSPELGYASLTELQSVHNQFRLPLERDRWFAPNKTLAEYAEEARAKGRIVA